MLDDENEPHEPNHLQVDSGWRRDGSNQENIVNQNQNRTTIKAVPECGTVRFLNSPRPVRSRRQVQVVHMRGGGDLPTVCPSVDLTLLGIKSIMIIIIWVKTLYYVWSGET